MIKTVALGIVIFAVIVAVAWVGFWIKKTTSYSFFYEDMVRATVSEMVKPEALR